MGLEFLARVRRTTAWATAVAALTVATYREPASGAALLLGATWSLVNLLLIEKLVVALTGPARGGRRAAARALLSVAGMIALFAAGALLLTRLSPIGLVAGFTIPFAVIVLKAAALLILPSRFWRRLVASRWRPALLLAGLALGAWLLIGAGSGPQSPGSGGAPGGDAHAPAAPADHGAPGGHESGGAEGAHGAHGGGGPEKFPNVVSILARAFPEASWAHFLHAFEPVVYSLFIAILISVVAFLATRKPALVPGPLQNVVELVVDGLSRFVIGILGPRHGPRYVAFLGTLFVYILVMNVFGLVPFMDSPTSSLNVTVALAIVVFVYSQFIGFRELGVVGYVDHMMGSPRTLIGWALVPLMLPIHLMGEIAKPISLSARLFGNIFGEDMLLVAFATLGVGVLGFANLPLGLPLHVPFLFLALLTSTLQALVFTVLSTIYFLLMLPHDDHAHEAEAAHAH